MAYTLSINIVLADTDTGLTLSAQLVDTAGANVGSAVTSGFVEFASGQYGWTYASFPDSFRGFVKFSSGGTFKAAVAINPQDAEFLDQKVSTPVYYADAEMNRDNSNAQDEYACTWLKNDSPITSGITSPTIEIIDLISNTTLLAETAMTASGTSFKYIATGGQRMSVGSNVKAIFRATIDGATRTWEKSFKRDS